MKGKEKKRREPKEPSLFVKIINIYWEQAKRRRALRLLQNQAWSYDFLAFLLVKASRAAGQNLSMTISNRQGFSYTITYDNAKDSGAVDRLDDSVFDHLDDDAAVADFVRRHSVR